MKIVKWEAGFCKACKEYDPVFTKAMHEWNVPHEKVDVEVEGKRAQEAHISVLPTTTIYNSDGEEVYRLIGKREFTELVDLIKEFKDA